MKRWTTFGTSIALAFFCVTFAGCKNYKEKVVGTWKGNAFGISSITLEKGGTGTMTSMKKGVETTDSMEWRLNGSNLIFKFGGREYGAIIKSVDDDKMVLHDTEAGQYFTFTRVK